MSILRQDVLIQREAEVRAAYQRDWEQLELLSGELLGALSQEMRAAPEIEGLQELLELVEKRHEEILRAFTYEDYRAEARAAWPEIRRSLYGYSELRYGNRNILSQAPSLVKSLSRRLREATRPILHFLQLLRKLDPERAESVTELLQAVPEEVPGLRQALQDRLEVIKQLALQRRQEALQLREQLLYLLQRLREVNAKMVAAYQKSLEDVWATFEREGRVEGLYALHANLSQKVVEEEELALRRRQEAIQVREKLLLLLRRLERVNAEMAASYERKFGEAWSVFERESRLEALHALHDELANKVVEQEQLALQRQQEAAQAHKELRALLQRLERVNTKKAAVYQKAIEEAWSAFERKGQVEPLRALQKELSQKVLEEEELALQRRLEAMKLREELFYLRERLERVNAEMAASYSKIIEEAWAAFERESRVEALKDLQKSLTQKVLEQERLYLAQRIQSQREAQAPGEGEFEGYRRRGAYYYERLCQLHSQAGQEATPLYEELRETTHLQRARAIKDELQYRYQKVLRRHLESETLKEEVAAVYASFPVERLREEVEAFRAQAEVTQEAAETLIQKILTTYQAEVPVSPDLRAQAEKALIGSLMEMLRSRGYQLLSDDMTAQLLQGEMVELRTPYGPDYAIRLRLENGALNMRFIRYIDDESKLSDYEKQKDKEIGHKWCQDYEGVRRLLEQNGIYLHTTHRIEPDEKFYYIRRSEASVYAAQRQQAPLHQKKQQK